MTLSGYSESHCQPGSVMPSGEVLGLPGQATSRLGLRLVVSSLRPRQEAFLGLHAPKLRVPLLAEKEGPRPCQRGRAAAGCPLGRLADAFLRACLKVLLAGSSCPRRLIGVPLHRRLV